ncbi:MAG: protein-L-isoaspartate O-methyltransferase [Dokdonella sp.]|uniref:protein-L-isoaspartate O-methyltransferase family protein n=1 Tax=Dokdonella sp. TaxID=2291710 RepID=UPI0025BCC936|nr:protein-L-isoaspartate O-methyltransferase [Dokdonella sp.]MBZ0223473.1 protein-L-isoaspartate O-methyltransferase [Dokdonella sp.]MCC7256624.1 protein-L-isoaspartate O-methyltransferase [Dokdonella sp.]
MSIDTELARNNMVENQIRPWEVLDPRVLDTLRELRRETFVPEAHRHLAFADIALPIGHGEVMFKPVIEGRILQSLALQGNERVLEIGTGSGFLTACMARLAASVTSVERHADLADAARARLMAARIGNVRVEAGDALGDAQTSETFDVVVLGGAVHSLPERLRASVRLGGRMLAFIGQSPAIEAVLLTRDATSKWTQTSLFDTDLPYLHHAEPPRRFAL